MTKDYDSADIEHRMQMAVEVLKQEFSGLRTGRASPHLLDPITVDAYGAEMPLNQLATVNVPDPRMLSVQVWDKANVAAVEKAIRNANLGLNPIIDGQNMRLPIPELNQERREELTKLAAKYAEQAKVAVRNVRRDGMDTLKKMERDHEISEDEHREMSDEVQQMTDLTVEEIDKVLAAKEQEIMQV